MAKYPPIQIVNDKDEPLGEASMHEAQDKGLVHRAVFISVENTEGKILLQKRAPTLVYHPNTWDISVGGHVDAGETYLEAAKREFKEELGLMPVSLKKVGKFYREVSINNTIVKQFVTVYKALVPTTIAFQPEPTEIVDLKWMTLPEVKALIRTKPDKVASGLTDFITRYY